MKKRKKTAVMILACAIGLTALILWIVWGNTALELNTYTIASERIPSSFDGYRIAHISDLHNAEMGDGNETLLSALKNAKPDLIAVTGDLIDSRHTDVETALRFAEEAVKIAPCCYVPGNHEARLSDYEALKKKLEEAGVVILEDTSVVLEREHQTISLMGLADPDFTMKGDLFGEVPAMISKKITKMRENSGDDYTILLSHRPELFEVYAECRVDFVLSGHAHGGQFRLPFVGGLIAPGQGLFPKYDAGLFTKENTTMIVSRGIGNSIFPFRFNNRPELVLIELQAVQ